MINNWSELVAAIKAWWHAPINLKTKVEEKPEPTYKTEDLLRPLPPHGDYPERLDQRVLDILNNSQIGRSRMADAMSRHERELRRIQQHIKDVNDALDNTDPDDIGYK